MDAAVVVLQRALVLTNAGVVEQKQGWNAIAVDVLARRWRRVEAPAGGRGAAPARGRPSWRRRATLSAADLGGALGWRLKRSRETLDELVELGAAERRELQGLALWNAAP